MAVRHDTFTAKIQEKLDSNGFLILKGRPTRAGVLIYRGVDGETIRELRHPDEVFKEDSMKSLALKPFTINHPGGLLSTDNTQVNSHGTTGENIARTDDDCLECTIAVQSKNAIEEIQNKGTVSLSAGYRCDIEHSSGVFQGHRFDQKQVNIVYNHVALVPKGRAGSQCSIRLDSDSAVLLNEINKEIDMVKKEIPAIEIGKGSNIVRLDTLIYEENPDNLKIIAQRSDLIVAVEKEQGRADKAEGEIVSLKKDKETLQTELKDTITKEQYRADVKDSVELLKMAGEIKLKVEDDYTVIGLKKAICLKINPDLDQTRADSSADYLDGVFSGIKKEWPHTVSKAKTLFGLKLKDGHVETEPVNKDGYMKPMQS